MLSMFGGRLEENEDPAVGAVRELHEETGVHLPLSQLNFLGDALFTREDGTQTHCSMFCALIVDLASMSVKEGEEYEPIEEEKIGELRSKEGSGGKEGGYRVK